MVCELRPTTNRCIIPQAVLASLILCLLGMLSTSVRADEKPALKPAPVAEEPAGEVVEEEAADEKKDKANKTPLALYVTVRSPVDDSIFRNVRNTALKLQELARVENRPAFLILEIRAGQSEFYQVHGLAKFLTSSKIDRVTTIAWVPETVTGNNVIVALGCQEIVMHPDAELGDIGRGKPVEPDEEQLVLSLAEKRHNLRLNRDLVLGMLNPQVSLLVATVEKDGMTEKRVVTEQQAKVLRDNGLAITDVEVIKDKGQRGSFSGREARELGILVSHTIDSQPELANLYGIDPQSLREKHGQGESSVVKLIDVTDIIDPVLEAFIQRQIDRALAENAEIIIFRIESPGGYLMSGTNLANMIADLEEKNVRTVAYVPDHAISSAAITALGCDEIYMGPDGQIGDAGVIRQEFDGAFERVPEKLLSPLRQTLISLAERKKRPPAILEAMSFKDLEVFQVTHRETGRVWYLTEADIEKSNGEWIKGPIVPESAKGLLLTLQDDRAVELKIAAGVVNDLDDLKDRLNIPADVELDAVGRTWVDSLIYLLNDPFITGFLLFVAIICIYIELHFMVGFFGICSALCFGIFFWSRYLGGTATGLEIVLFMMGIACILMEIFVIPGFGVFGVSGGLLMVLSLILASETFNNIEPEVNSQKFVEAVTILLVPLAAVIVSSMFINKYLPQIPLLRHIVLVPPIRKHAGDTDTLQLRPDLADGKSGLFVGKQGVASTILRPSGKARFENELVDVVTQGPYIAANSPVEIIEVRGRRVVVRSLPEST